MKVADLIAILQTLDPEATAVIIPMGRAYVPVMNVEPLTDLGGLDADECDGVTAAVAIE